VLGLCAFGFPYALPTLRLLTETPASAAPVKARLPVLVVPTVGFPKLAVPQIPKAPSVSAPQQTASAHPTPAAPAQRARRIRVPIVKDSFTMTPPPAKKKAAPDKK
jgi:hypothetical protein